MAARNFLVDIEVAGKVTADSGFAVTGGVSSGFLKANGTIDSNQYTQAPSIFTAASESAQLALTTVKGDIVVRSDESKSYMHNGAEDGAEILTYPNFSSVAYPWNHGSWSYLSPTTDGSEAELEVVGGDYPTVNPRIEQAFTTVSGDDYNVEFTTLTDGIPVQVMIVDPANGYAYIDDLTVTNTAYTQYSFSFTAASASTAVQILVQGVEDDYVYMTQCSVKPASGMAKWTMFAVTA